MTHTGHVKRSMVRCLLAAIAQGLVAGAIAGKRHLGTRIVTYAELNGKSNFFPPDAGRPMARRAT